MHASKKTSISTKLNLVVIACFAIITIAVLSTFFVITGGLLRDNLNDTLLLKAQSVTNGISSAISGHVANIENFVFELENTTDCSEDTIKDAIDKRLSTFPRDEVAAFYVAYGERNYLYETLGWVPNDEYRVKDRPWYSNPIAHPGINVLTYEDANSGVFFVCISTKIKTDTGEPAVLAIDLSVTSTFEANKLEKSTEYFFIEDTQGKIIYHPNADFMPHDGKVTMTPDAHEDYSVLASLTPEKIATIHDYDGKEYVFTVSEIENGDFRVYTGIQTATVSNELTRVILIGATLAVVLLGLTALGFFFLFRGLIVTPLRFAAKYISDVAETGDLSVADERSSEIERYIARNDEIASTLHSANSLFAMMKEQGRMLQRIAERDFGHTIRPRSENSTIDILAMRLLDELNHTMSEIQNSSAQVSAGAKQIADGSQALSQSSVEQATTVEQLSSSISEIAEKTIANAEMANKAAALANTIKGNAEKGSRQMDEMTAAVKDINQASQQISKVIKVIDDIAFQTNILALNAAVEAARAGQYGKGFAVVAEEVRNLASKSAEAAKDTGNLIEDTIEKAELGNRIAGDTAASLAKIVSGINESSQLVSQIAQASDAQSSGIMQVNRSIDQVAQVVQQNSATAEESAAAAQEMSGQSAILEELIAQFKLRDSERSSGTVAPSCVKTLDMPQENAAFLEEHGGTYGKY